jgi:ribosomal protein L9
MRKRHEAQGEEQARDIAHTLNRTVLTIKARSGTEDRLYGSVTSSDIADAIWKARKIRIDRRKVDMDDAIKALGSYKVGVTVWGDVTALIKVMVVPGAAGARGPALPCRSRHAPDPVARLQLRPAFTPTRRFSPFGFRS